MKTKMTMLDLIYNRVTNCISGLFKIVSICFFTDVYCKQTVFHVTLDVESLQALENIAM